MSRFVLSPAARRDLHDIWEYIAEDSVPAADRFVKRIHDVILKLVAMPSLGVLHEDLADETLRVWPVKSYLIVYRPETRPLEIVRIVSGYRDLPALFP
jgi:antitoxin ParD1/3/4/toxin ParE1/3/4